jgi:hypothetical protein
MTMQTPRAQVAVIEGAVRAVSHLKQKLGNIRILKEE